MATCNGGGEIICKDCGKRYDELCGLPYQYDELFAEVELVDYNTAKTNTHAEWILLNKDLLSVQVES